MPSTFNLIGNGITTIDLKNRVEISEFIFVAHEACRDEVGTKIPWILKRLASKQSEWCFPKWTDVLLYLSFYILPYMYIRCLMRVGLVLCM